MGSDRGPGEGTAPCCGEALNEDRTGPQGRAVGPGLLLESGQTLTSLAPAVQSALGHTGRDTRPSSAS